MNGKTKLILTLVSILFTLTITVGAFWAGQVQKNGNNIDQHRTESIHPGAAKATDLGEMNVRVRANEVRFEEILRRLEAIDTKLSN